MCLLTYLLTYLFTVDFVARVLNVLSTLSPVSLFTRSSAQLSQKGLEMVHVVEHLLSLKFTQVL